MEFSSVVLPPFLDWGPRSFDETVVGNRRLHLLESSGTSLACFSFCRLEEMKLWSLILSAQARHTRWDDVSDLSISRPISDFWNPLRLFWYFSPQKSVRPPLCFNWKTLGPPLLGEWPKVWPPLTTTWYVPCHTNLRTFRSWTKNVWICLDIECMRDETGKCEWSVWDLYVL